MYSNKVSSPSEYGFFDNGGNGDCFFLSLLDNLKRYDRRTGTVEALRTIVADNVNQEQLEQYNDLKEYYNKGMPYFKNIEELKNYILTSNFWADDFAINVLANTLGIGILIYRSSSPKGMRVSIQMPSIFEGLFTCFHYYQDVHYQSLLINGESTFSIEKLQTIVEILQNS